MPERRYALLVFAMAVSGAGSLGFIGLGLRVAVEVGAPIPDVYAPGSGVTSRTLEESSG